MGTFAFQFLNAFFMVFHTLLIVFNVFGWAWKKSRKWNLVTLGVTAFSWLVMGIWKGVGYCVCTDWHFQVRRAMGINDPENSYIDFLFRVVSGWSPDPNLTRAVAGWVFAISIVLSVGLNARDWRSRESLQSAVGS